MPVDFDVEISGEDENSSEASGLIDIIAYTYMYVLFTIYFWLFY